MELFKISFLHALTFRSPYMGRFPAHLNDNLLFGEKLMVRGYRLIDYSTTTLNMK